MKAKQAHSIALFGTLFYPLFAHAVTNDADVDYFQLPLSELQNLTITVASKKAEPLRQAPSVVNIITHKQIESYGANNLHDVLRRVPGLYPNSAITLRDNVVSIRGQHSSSIDRRTLLLLNGRPFRDANSGGLNSAFYRSFPIASIERIEVIRGPGSVLYGSNALSGVINIITREKEGSKIEIAGGSFSTISSQGYTVERSGKLLVQASAKWAESDGWDYQTIDANGVADNMDYGYKDYGINLDIQYAGARLNWFEANANDDIIRGNYTWPATYYKKQRRFIDAGYNWSINTDWSVQTNITYNSQNRAIDDQSVDIKDEYTLAEVATSGKLGKSGSLVAGLTYHDLSNEDYSNPLEPASDKTHWKTIYAQYSHAITTDLRGTIGAQNNITQNENETSYRAGVVYQIDNNWGMKLLWAEAFRSPYSTEKTFNSSLLKGNPNQISEKNESWDAQLFYHSDKYFIELSYYDSTLKDASVIVPSNSGGLTFSNAAEMEFKGYELEAKAQLLDNLSVEGSYSHQQNTNQNGVKDTQIIPNDVIRLGLSYQHQKGISIGLFDTYYTDPTDWSEFRDNVPQVNPDAKSYHHITLNIRTDLARLMDDPSLKGASVSLWMDNALESEAVYQPEIRYVGVNTVPLRAERAVYLKGEYRW